MPRRKNPGEQDERFPSGPWRGFWMQDGYRGWMDLQLDFHEGKIAGRGSDSVGEFVFLGTYDTKDGRVLMTKQYIDQHKVEYEGWAELQHGIWGLWNLLPHYRGGWQIRPLGHSAGSSKHTRAKRPRKRSTPTSSRR